MKKSFLPFLLCLLMALLTPWVTTQAEVLTVYDGTTSCTYVPIYGYYSDYGTRSQMLIPSNILEDMEGGDITAMKFYAQTSSQNLTGVWEVYLKEVTETSVSTSFISRDGATLVWTGSPSIVNSEMDIEFSQAFSYGGGNLMIEFVETTTGNSPSITWYGVDGSSLYKNGTYSDHTSYQTASSGTLYNIVPKTTFTYTPGAPPACPKPKNLAAGNVAANSATLTWTAGGTETEWLIEYGTDPELKSPDLQYVYDAPSFDLSGLTANTVYYASVKAVCSEESAPSAAISFKTACESITIDAEHPSWIVDFEDMTANTVPLCWDNSASTSTDLSAYPEYIWGVYSYGGNKMLRLHNWSAHGPNALINSPSIVLPAAPAYELTFDYTHNATCGDFTVKISTDGGSNWTDLKSYSKGNGSSYSDPGTFTTIEPAIDLTDYAGHTVMIQFYAEPNYGSGAIFVDNISIQERPSCLKPSGLTYADVQKRSAKLSWTENGTATAWDVCLNGDESNLVTADTHDQFEITLEPATAYTIKVRANCGQNGVSEWSNEVSFTTPLACPPLASISVIDTQRRSITVSGFEGACQLVWAASEEPLTDEQLDAATKQPVNAATYTIEGLERETKYYIYARVNCDDDGDGVSEWVSTEATTKGLNGCDEVPVGSGTSTSSSIPTHSNFNYSLSEQIYKAAEIGEAGNISSIAFYNAGSLKTRTLDVYMLHTSKAEFESSSDWVTVAESDKVFSGSVSFTANAWVTIDLPTPFAYNGTDNLLLVVDDNSGSYSSGLSCRTYSVSQNEALYKYQDNNDINPTGAISVTGTASKSKSQVKFTFCYSNVACPAITGLDHALVDEGTTKANISWSYSGADYLSGFEIVRSETVTSSEAITPEMIQDLAADVNSVSYTDLTAGTHYYIYVRAKCQAESHDDGNSEWASTDFFTNADCPKVLNLAANLTATNAVHIAWDPAFAGQDLHFQYVLSKTELDAAALEAETPVLVDDATSKDIDELEFEQEYHIYVASVCNADHSAYEHVSFTTLAACQAVKTPLVASRLEHNLVELTWESADLASETQWEVGIVGDESKKQFVTERKALIFGLTAETNYTAYVKAVCGENESSDAVELLFTTAPQPGNCKQVGDGTASANVVYTTYGNTYSQHIYTAAELTEMGCKPGTITALSFYYSGTSSSYEKTQSIYIGAATASSFAGYTPSDFIGDLNLVYGPTLLSYQAGWREYAFATPYVWDGESNIVVGVLTNSTASSASGWSTYGTSTSPDYRSVYRYMDYTPIDITNLSSVSNGSRSYNLPNIQFCFEPKDCPDVKNLAVDEASISTTGATVSWEPMGSETAWNVLLSTNSEETDFSAATEHNKLDTIFSNLEQGTDYYVYVQPVCNGADFSKVSFTTVASCKVVTNLMTEFIEPYKATVSWTDIMEQGGNPEGTDYIVAYAPTSSVEFDPTAAGVLMKNVEDATSTFLSGLAPNTQYTFAVKANCGVVDNEIDYSRWSDTASFKTAYAVPFSEAFGIGSSIPADWNRYTGLLSDVLGGAALTAITSGWNFGTANDVFDNHARVNIYGTSCKYWLVTPNIYLSQDNIQLTFDLALTLYSTTSTATPTDDDRFVVLISTDNGATWTILREWNNTGSEYVYDEISTTGKLATIDLSSYYNANPLNAVKIAFYGESTTSGGDYNLHIDNVSIDVIPDCAAPTGLAIVENSITTDGASFTWDNIEGGAWKYAYALASEAEPADEAFADVAENTVPVSGLTDNSDYIFYLRQVCGGAMSESVTKPFHTKQAPESVPYSTDFESGNDWMFINGTLTNAWAYGEAAHDAEEHNHALYISNDGGTTNAYTNNLAAVVYAVKLFHFDEGKYSFSYYWKANGENYSDYLRVALVPASVTLTAGTSLPSGVSTTGLPTGWIALDGGSKLNGKTDWQSFSSADLDIEEGDYNVVLLWRDDSSAGTNPPAAVDNFNIAKITCPKPTALSIPEATKYYNSAQVYFEVADGTTTAHLQYKEATAEEWTTVENVTLPYTIENLTTGTTYLVRAQAVCGGEDFSDWTEPIDFTPECKEPTLVTSGISNIGTTSADIAWTANGGEDTWNIQYKLSTEEDWTTVPGITENPYTLENLLPGKTYQVKVEVASASCEGTYSSAVSFNTECLAAYTIEDAEHPWRENFNGLTSGIPNCWNNDEGSTTSATQKWSYYATGHEGACLRFNSYGNTEGNTNFLKTPAIAVTQAVGVKFWFKNPTGGDFSVFYAIDGEQQPDALFSGLTAQSEWTEKEVYLSDDCIGHNVTIIFKGTSNYGNGDAYIYLDDVEIALAPDCKKPEGLVVSDITAEGATFTWTAENEASYVYAVAPAGDPEPANSQFVPAENGSVTIIGKNDNTDYVIYLRQSCDGPMSKSLTASFRTLQAPVALPYATDFEDGNDWVLINGSCTNVWAYGEAASNGEGTHALYISNDEGASNAYTVNATAVAYAVKAFDFAAGTYTFQYDWMANGETSSYSPYTKYDYLRVFLVPASVVLTAGTSLPTGLTATALPDGWIALDGGNALNNVTSWQTFTSNEIAVPAGTYNVVLLWRDDSSGGTQSPAAVDNFSISVIACAQPSALEVPAANITSTTASVQWTENGTATAWQICLNGDEVNLTDINSNPYVLTGLTPGTPYTVKVRANCDSEQSAWSETVNFNTVAACQTPDGLAASNITNNSASISWNTYSQVGFNLRYRKAGTEDWETKTNVAQPCLIDELEKESTYEVEVQVACDAPEIWSSTYSFKTAYGVPFSEAFGSSVPADWARYSGLLNDVMSGSASLATTTSGWSFGTGNNVFDNHAKVNIFGTSCKYWLATPVVYLTDATAQLTFNLALTAYSGNVAASGTCLDDRFAVVVSADNGETWSILREWNNSGSQDVYNNIPVAGTEVAINLNAYIGQGIKLAFYGESTVTNNGDNNLHIDNVMVDVIPSCPKPTNLAVADVIYNAATLSWTAGASESKWELQYSTSQTDWSQAVVLDNLTANSLNLSDLTPGTTYYARVRAICGDNDESEWSQIVSFIPQCLAPTFGEDAVSNFSTTGATITWNAGNGETKWTLKYKKSSETNWTEKDELTTPTFTLSGLTSGTTYQVQVVSVCGKESAIKDFNTECETITSFPYSENFDGMTGSTYSQVLPVCWSYINNCSYSSYNYYPMVYSGSSYANSGANSLKFYSYYSSWSDYDPQDQYAVLPEMEGISGLRMRFNARAASTTANSGNFTVGVMTDPANTSTFVPVEAKAPAGTTYEAMEVRFNTYAGEGKYIAIKMEAASSSLSTRGFYIDDIVIDEIPDCEEASGLALVSVAANSASFTWDAEGGAWKYAYALASEDEPAVENFTAITTNSVAVSGLTDNADYIFYLRRDCGTSVSPSISVPFHTDQLPVAVGNGWSDDFENGNNWKFVNSSNHGWVLGGTVHNGDGSHAIYVSTDNGNTNSYNNGSTNIVYATKLFDFQQGQYIFQYDWMANGEGATYDWDYLRVALVPANTNLTAGSIPTSFTQNNLPAGWIALDGGSLLNLKSTWQTKETDEITVAAGTYMVVFAWKNDGSAGSNPPAAIDNFSITKMTCLKPTGLTASAASGSSINLSWTQGNEETAWDAQYRIGSGAWTMVALTDAVINGTSCSATLNGLEPQTTYEIQVRANCGDVQSSWSASATETTLCATAELPFSEDFNSLTSGIPACWNNEEGTTAAAYRWNYYGTGHDGACVRFNSYNNALNNTNSLKTPAITISDDAAVLNFWYKNPEGGDFSVLYALDGVLQDAPLASNLTGAADWTEMNISLAACAGHDVVIIFKGTSNRNTSASVNVNAFIYLDDVRIARELILSDHDVNNGTTLANNMGKTMDVTIGRTFTCAGEDHYNTICLPFSLSAEQLAASPIASNDLWAFKYAKVDEVTNELLFRIVQAESIEAGKPYFIGFESGADIVNPKFENVTITASVGQNIGDESVAQLRGIFVPEEFKAGDETKLFLYTQTNTLYWWNGNHDSQLYGFRAFFKVNVNTGGGNNAPIFHGMSARFIKADDQVPTGIDQTDADNTAVEVQKLIENDHVVIIRNGVKYSIQGQVISK